MLYPKQIVPSVSRICVACGAELPESAPGNRCPKCLFELALNDSAPNTASPGPEKVVVHTEEAGERIGRYKLLQKIGEGGMGVIYMAEQREPVVRKVALKIIKAGMDTGQVIARFEAERQALALMDHPNIAKVLDGGATATGRPYFVMDLVQGLPITQFCDEAKLSTAERLELFLDVCTAIQHAHQKGIIHRDIKPSNILVTLDGYKPVPKVIDFGIAKATQQPLTDKTLFTQFQQFMGTPAYVSPEQATLSALEVDTRSDVYSLGVLLYELLTDETPFATKDLLSAGLEHMQRTLREKEPPPPSAKLGTLQREDLAALARRHKTEAPKLIHTVRGDLDWIVMKCLEKDRARRYETVSSLLLDIRRHLDHEPIAARPPSSIYRLQRLVRRHRVAFVGAAAIVAALVIGLGTSLSLLRSERAARQRALAAEHQHNRLRQEAEDARTKEAALRVEAENSRASERKLREEAERARAHEAMLRQQVEVAEKSAQSEAIQLGDALAQLGKLEAAETFIRKSLAVQRKRPDSEDLQLATSLINLANVLIRQDKNLPEAEAACREALALRRKLLGDEHVDVAHAMDRLAMTMSKQGKNREAEATHREALQMRRKLLGNEHIDVANSLLNLGWIFRAENRFSEAEPIYAEALGISRRLLGNEHPYVHSVLNIISEALFDNHRAAEAEPLVRECLRIREKKNPDESLTFATQNLLGAVLLDQGKYAEAEPLLLSSYEALEEREKMAGNSQDSLRKALVRLAQLYEAVGQPEQAAGWKQKLRDLGRNE